MSLLKEFILKNPNIRLWLVLDNIRSAYNVGAMFRTADATGITGMILIGITPSPKEFPQKIQKTALGAQNTVPYLYYEKSDIFLEDIKEIKGMSNLISLELTSRAIDLFKWNPFKGFGKAERSSAEPYFIVVGHELLGVSAKLLVASSTHLFIPMRGYKESLNVAESSSILMYEFFRKIFYNCD